MKTSNFMTKFSAYLLGGFLCMGTVTVYAVDHLPYELEGDTEDSTAAAPGDGTAGDYGDAIRAAASGDDADTVFLQECKAGTIVLPLNDPGSIYNADNCGAGWSGGIFETDFDPNGDSATGAFDQVFIDDAVEADITHHRPSNKDEAPIGGAAGGGLSAVSSDPWGCVSKPNVNNKNDLLQGVVTFYKDPVSGAINSYAGANRDSNEGNENLGVWYLKDPNVNCDSSGSGDFEGVHMDGDKLVVGEFTNGGSVATIKVFEWQDPTPGAPESGDEELVEIDSGSNCSAPHADDEACGEVNDVSIYPAWMPITFGSTQNGTNNKPKFGELQPNLWAEMGAQIIAPGTQECFSKVLIESRTSQSVDANLFDYMLADVNICGRVTIEKVTLGDTGTFDIDTNIPNLTNAAGTEPSAGDFDLTTTAAGIGGLASETFIDIQEGAYTVTENVPVGWRLIEMSCSGDVAGGVDSTHPTTTTPPTLDAPIAGGGTGTFTVNLEPGEHITCRFVNEALGDISATKTVINACDANDGGLFTLRLDGVNQAGAIDIGNGGGYGPTEVTPATYTVDEVAGTGTNLSDYTASISGDCAANGSVTVGTGESKTCDIINVRRPTVTVIKEVTGGSLAKFDLLIDDGDTGTFDHESENKGDGGTTGAVRIDTVKSGSGISTTYGPVEVAETAANGPGNNTIVNPIPGFHSFWHCDDVGESGGVGTSVVINELLPGEDVVCKVTNVPVAAASCQP